MALTRTQLFSGNSPGGIGSASYTSSSFTPANNCLLVAIGGGNESSDGGMRGGDLVISDSLGTLSWTSRVVTVDAPGWSYGRRIWTAPVTTGASMTVTLDAGSRDMNELVLQVQQYTSDSGSVGTGATAVGSDPDGDGAGSITLTAAPATSSDVIAAVMTALASGSPGTLTAGTGWTQLTQISIDGWAVYQSQSRTGSTSTAVGWDDLLATGTSGGGAVMVALEITEIVSGGGNVLAWIRA